ncbi:DUF4870 domain-containing protein [Brevibacterium otitidis]|uniref:DUF4870 domain-containing protein n=1 Tax=Brevibacterium otitidis TaxID=53364 RepID=A0ABV5X479_9MICO|nr:hypothetical protein GCM10023233_10990 [Brevibacterium otitidis]
MSSDYHPQGGYGSQPGGPAPQSYGSQPQGPQSGGSQQPGAGAYGQQQGGYQQAGGYQQPTGGAYGQQPGATAPNGQPLGGSTLAGVPLTAHHPEGAYQQGSAGYWHADAEERQMAMWNGIGSLLIGFVMPLILFIVYKDRSAFVREHARQLLNASLSYLIYILALTVVLTIITIVTFGIGGFLFILLVAPGIMLTVFEIIAAVRGSNGEGYRAPLTINMVK